MTRYLLDSNVITELEDRRKPDFRLIAEKLSKLADEDEVCISILSAFEYQYGIARAPEELKESLRKSWNDFEARFQILGLSLEGASLYGEIKTEYEKYTGVSRKSLQGHTVDLILASTALEHGAVLVSSDRVFQSLRKCWPSLEVEDWIKSDPSSSAEDEPSDGADA